MNNSEFWASNLNGNLEIKICFLYFLLLFSSAIVVIMTNTFRFLDWSLNPAKLWRQESCVLLFFAETVQP